MICESLRPNQTVIGCIPALFKGVQEDIDFITNYPVITLEGHPAHFGAILLEEYPRDKEVIEIDIESFLKDKRIEISDSTARALGANGEKAVKLLAEHTAKIVDELLQASAARSGSKNA
jgi:hypothetical protein